ncbi:hypothetical protein EV202_10872 [Bacteroides heparinolyticus]|uniref:Uncharacterized protein n=1 Tax=Prevotella heparinolytica TaxID=28113 RepID=A0A4R2LRF0_9BACE|nr:hypothetical protein EV202_10872 [Bacteroides heparinolyticus]
MCLLNTRIYLAVFLAYMRDRERRICETVNVAYTRPHTSHMRDYERRIYETWHH